MSAAGPGTTVRGRRPDRAALVAGVLLVAAGAALAWDAATIRSGVAGYSRIGPAAFPYVVAGCLGLLGIATVISGFRRSLAGGPLDLNAAPVLWIVGGLAAQIAFLSFAGFSIATGFVFAATARAFGKKKLWLTYPIGVAVALVVWLVFAMALRLVLPAGPIETAASSALTALFSGGG